MWPANAVKHFKFKRAANGVRRLHQKPERLEVAACKPWLLAEIAADLAIAAREPTGDSLT